MLRHVLRAAFALIMILALSLVISAAVVFHEMHLTLAWMEEVTRARSGSF